MTTGTFNVAIGHESGAGITTGDYNICVGDRAGRLLGAGAENVLIGHQAGYNTTTGNYNTCIGFKTLFGTNTGASFNTSLGFGALNASAQSFSTAIGGYSMHYATSAERSCAVGYQSLFALTTGSNNTAVGHQAIFAVTTGSNNTAVGRNAGDSVTTGANNTFVGQAAGDEATTGDYNICIGHGSGSGSSPFHLTDQSGRVVIGDNSITNSYIKVDWTITSDKRDKTEFKEIPHGLDFVSKLKPTSFKFRKDRDSEETQGQEKYGFIAQDILEIEGDNPVIIDNLDEDHLGYTESNLVPVLVKAIQELKAEVDKLKQECKCK